MKVVKELESRINSSRTVSCSCSDKNVPAHLPQSCIECDVCVSGGDHVGVLGS